MNKNEMKPEEIEAIDLIDLIKSNYYDFLELQKNYKLVLLENKDIYLSNFTVTNYSKSLSFYVSDYSRDLILEKNFKEKFSEMQPILVSALEEAIQKKQDELHRMILDLEIKTREFIK